MAKNRDLMVLTRKEGVRKENPYLTVGQKYFPVATLGGRYGARSRTPADREAADARLAREQDMVRRERQRPIAVQRKLKGMTIRGTKK